MSNDMKIIIPGNGRHIAKPVSLTTPSAGQRIGVAKGHFSVPDDIDADNDVIIKLFDGTAERIPSIHQDWRLA